MTEASASFLAVYARGGVAYAEFVGSGDGIAFDAIPWCRFGVKAAVVANGGILRKIDPVFAQKRVSFTASVFLPAAFISPNALGRERWKILVTIFVSFGVRSRYNADFR